MKGRIEFSNGLLESVRDVHGLNFLNYRRLVNFTFASTQIKIRLFFRFSNCDGFKNNSLGKKMTILKKAG